MQNFKFLTIWNEWTDRKMSRESEVNNIMPMEDRMDEDGIEYTINTQSYLPVAISLPMTSHMEKDTQYRGQVVTR